MAEVGAIAEDNEANKAIYDKICPSVVEIVCYNSVAPHNQICSIPGVIAKLGDDYCYVIAYNKDNLLSNGQFDVILPGKEEKIKIPKELLGDTTRSKMLGFNVGSVVISRKMKVVHFGKEDVSMGDKVFTVGFDMNFSSCRMSPGEVTYGREAYFSHDSPPHECTIQGDLVFNKQSELVGICCEDRGVTEALNVKSITKCLSSYFWGTEERTLDDILHHIDAQTPGC